MRLHHLPSLLLPTGLFSGDPSTHHSPPQLLHDPEPAGSPYPPRGLHHLPLPTGPWRPQPPQRPWGPPFPGLGASGWRQQLRVHMGARARAGQEGDAEGVPAAPGPLAALLLHLAHHHGPSLAHGQDAHLADLPVDHGPLPYYRENQQLAELHPPLALLPATASSR